MKFSKIAITLSLLLFFSCQSFFPKEVHDIRSAASYQNDDNEQKHLRTFEQLMNHPDDSEKSREFANYLNRQRSFFYIAQQLLFQFDQKLDVIYNKKQIGEHLTLTDVNEFTKIRFQNLIAWEFAERNLHEILDLYYLALKHANTEGSPYQKSCKWIVTNVKKWIDEAWKKGDKSAIITLAQHLNDVNVQLGTELEKVKAPSFVRYLNPSEATLKEAHNRTKYLVEHRKKTTFDTFIENKWTEYLNQRRAEDEEEFLASQNSFRTPQALDVLEPSPDGKGHVTGNRFPMGKWAMTFDDGPNPTYTQGMMNNLKNNNVHGTFFWQTQNILKYPSYANKKSDLFSRASHSYTHANLPKQSTAGLDKEINKAATDFAKIVGEKPTMYRCPYGACGPSNSAIRKMIAAQKMLHIGWNVDTLDWQDKNPESIYQRSKKQIDSLGRGIVLFHDIHPQSVTASDKIIKYLKSKYTIAPLHKLIEESRGKPYHTP